MTSTRWPWATAIGGLLIATTAAADWPVPRHDPQRTGTSPHSAALAEPTIAWRYLLGADLWTDALTTVDTDGDGIHEIVFVEGGRVVARSLDDTMVWSTAIGSVQGIELLTDMNGDGREELVVTSDSGFVHLLNTADGRVLWRSPYLGDEAPEVRVGNVEGPDEPLPELVADAHGGPGGGQTGSLIIEFDSARRDGEAFPIRHWWTHDEPADPITDTRDRHGGRSVTFADVTGDGRDEVIVLGDYGAYVYRGIDGLKLTFPESEADGGHPLISPGAPGHCGPIGVRYGLGISSVYDLPDGGQGVMFSLDAADTGRQFFTLEWRGDAERPHEVGRLAVTRHWSVPRMERDRHRRIDDALIDLDGDGRPEIVTGGRVNGREAVRILGTHDDVALNLGPWPAVDCVVDPPERDVDYDVDYDHAVLGSIADATPTAIWPDAVLDDEGRRRPLVLVARNGVLLGYRMVRVDDPRDDTDRVAFAAIEHFRLPGHGRVNRYDAEREPGGGLRWHPTLVDVSDGRRGMVVSDGTRLSLMVATEQGVEVATRTSEAGDLLPARYAIPEGVRIFRYFVHRDVNGRPGLILFRDDGRLTTLDAELRPLHVDGLGQAAVRVRAYSGAASRARPPVAASFDGLADEVIATRARGGIVRLDARDASLGEPPTELWRWDDVVDPILWDLDSDGRPEVIVHHDDAIEARRADGRTVLFRTQALQGAQRWSRTSVPGVDVRDPNGVRLHSVASDRDSGLSAVFTFTSSGAIDWISQWSDTAQSNLGFATPDDSDGDGTDNVFVGFSSSLRWLDAIDGILRGTFDNTTPEWLVVVRGRVDGVDYVKTGGALVGAEIAEPPNFRRAFKNEDFVTSEFGVAVVECGERLVVAGPVNDTNGFQRADVADGEDHVRIYLAGGHAYPTAEAVPPEDAGGLLGTTSGIAALYGDRSAVVVGSTDGHLYAVDPCPEDGPEMIWALPLGRAVGVPIFADTDGDGAEEIVVPVADGYLYGIDTAGTPSPEWAHDVAAPDAIEDINRSDANALHFAWAEVPGAVAYEYAVLDADQALLTPFLRTFETRATYANGLVFGARYSVAVRALGRQGTSPETFSDGVRWLHDREACADRDDDGFCEADDCDPDDPERFPYAVEVCHAADGMDGIDDDCDGVVDEGCPCFDGDGDGVCPDEGDGDGDCDDRDPSIRPGLLDRCDGVDADCDGEVDEDQIASCCFDRDRDGVCDVDDCQPNDPERHQGAADLTCDGVDQDCDGVDGPLPCDQDCDGACEGAGPHGGDCDDGDASRHPRAVEIANDEIDSNCDGSDNPLPCDADGDGFCPDDGDCDDDDAARHPAAVDECGDGVDLDCNGVDGPIACDSDCDRHCAPEDCAADDPEIHPAAPDLTRNGVDENCDGFDGPLPCDADADGHCPPEDCADGDPSRHPGVDEQYNGIDDDCDGATDEGLLPTCEDADEDGICAGVDCADDDPTRRPGVDEIENGVDDDCDNAIDEGFPVCIDADGDGACVPVDCADNDPTRRPSMPERLDGVDDDCDGEVDEGAPPCPDTDKDGACDAQDCQPSDPVAHPGAAERPGDGLDDDCDGLVDEFVCVDNDRDGACAVVDCDDTNPEVHPGRDEVEGNGEDDDCDGRVDELACAVPDGGVPGEEFCGNGLDDDCDGVIDEGCGAARRGGTDGCAVSRPRGSRRPAMWLLPLLGLLTLGRRRQCRSPR